MAERARACAGASNAVRRKVGRGAASGAAVLQVHPAHWQGPIRAHAKHHASGGGSQQRRVLWPRPPALVLAALCASGGRQQRIICQTRSERMAEDHHHQPPSRARLHCIQTIPGATAAQVGSIASRPCALACCTGSRARRLACVHVPHQRPRPCPPATRREADAGQLWGAHPHSLRASPLTLPLGGSTPRAMR